MKMRGILFRESAAAALPYILYHEDGLIKWPVSGESDDF
jgi:hypothetical protein